MSASKRAKAKREAMLAAQSAERKRQEAIKSVKHVKLKARPTKKYIRETPVIGSFTGIASRESCAAKPSPKYTGDLITGIATMHKSNAVPVLNQQDATDIANMRRS